MDAFLLTANGLSIWGWRGLVAYFIARADRDEEPSRTLHPRPLLADTVGCTFVEEFATPGCRISPSSHSRQYESLAEMKAGMIMTAVFVVCLAVGNLLALAWSVTHRP